MTRSPSTRPLRTSTTSLPVTPNSTSRVCAWRDDDSTDDGRAEQRTGAIGQRDSNRDGQALSRQRAGALDHLARRLERATLDLDGHSRSDSRDLIERYLRDRL